MEGIAPAIGKDRRHTNGLGTSRKTEDAPIKPARPRPPHHLKKPFRDLMSALRSDKLGLRLHALIWLYQNTQHELVNMVLDDLEADRYSRTKKVRKKAYELLAMLVGIAPQRLSLDMLVRCLRSPNPELRRQAAEVIGDRGKVAKPALAALHQALNDPDPEVQFRVAVAIGVITGSIPPKPGTASTTGGEHAGGQEHSNGKDGERPE